MYGLRKAEKLRKRRHTGGVIVHSDWCRSGSGATEGIAPEEAPVLIIPASVNRVQRAGTRHATRRVYLGHHILERTMHFVVLLLVRKKKMLLLIIWLNQLY